MQAFLSHGGDYLFRGDAPPRETLVATIDGIVCLERGRPPGGWQAGRRLLEGKHVSAIMRAPGTDVLFVGTHGDGLYASEDDGRTWERRDRDFAHPDVYALNAVVAGDELRLYAGTDQVYLYVSTDLGRTWRELPGVRTTPTAARWSFPGRPAVPKLKNVNFAPGDPNQVYASVEVGALLKSEDAGATWRELSVPEAGLDVHRVVIPPSHPTWLYITGGDGIYHSRDDGATWEQLTTRSSRISYPDSLLFHPDDEQRMFTGGSYTNPANWGMGRPADSALGRSRDGGRTWETLTTGLPDLIHGNVEAMSLAAWPGGFALFAGTTDGDVFVSEDGGDSWTVVGGLPAVSKTTHYLNFQRPERREPVGAV